MSDGFHFDDRDRFFSFAGIARKLRHRAAGVGVLIFSYARVGQQFAFNHDLSVGDRFLINGFTLRHLHRFAAQRAGDT